MEKRTNGPLHSYPCPPPPRYSSICFLSRGLVVISLVHIPVVIDHWLVLKQLPTVPAIHLAPRVIWKGLLMEILMCGIALRLTGRVRLVVARKEDASIANQAAITNVAALAPFSGGVGLIQTTSGCCQQKVRGLQRRGWRCRACS